MPVTNPEVLDDFCNAFIAENLPRALVKALEDHFDYALGLRNGQVIHFTGALLTSSTWVHLSTQDVSDSDEVMPGVDLPFERGIDVRLSDIMWVADAPHGS